MRLLKMMVAILILLVSILVLASLALYFLLDPNQLKPSLIAEVKQKTGYELVIDGKMSWSFLPTVGLAVEHMTLAVPNQTPFLDISQIKLASSLSQLLHGEETLQGHVQVAALTLLNVHAENIQADLHRQPSGLMVQAIQADLYGGKLQGSAQGSQLFINPQWSWDLRAQGVQVRPLLDAINGPEQRIHISGTAQIAFRASMQGKQRLDLLNSLNGDGQFLLQTGNLEGIALNYYIEAANALLNKLPMPPKPAIDQTLFSGLTGSFTIKNGVAATNNLLLTAQTFNTNGQGSLTLLDEQLNLQLQLVPHTTGSLPWQIPVIVTGDLTHPAVSLDQRELEKFLLQQQLDKLKTKANEEIQKHMPGEAGKFLQNLLNK